MGGFWGSASFRMVRAACRIIFNVNGENIYRDDGDGPIILYIFEQKFVSSGVVTCEFYRAVPKALFF